MFLDRLAVEHQVPGFAFAAFDDTGPVYEHVAGVKSRVTLEPLDPTTVFEAASISKPVFAYLLFSLAADALLDLDAPLDTLVQTLPELAHDRRTATLTPRILLTHQGGLPNWRGAIRTRRDARIRNRPGHCVSATLTRANFCCSASSRREWETPWRRWPVTGYLPPSG